MKTKATDGKCIVPDCERKAYQRGMCQTCLANAHAAINRGVVTEAELIRKKLMLPAKKRGPKPTTEFAKALVATSAKSRK